MTNDRAHEREYESTREIIAGANLPKWCDLTEDQRKKVRQGNLAYWQEMREFGASLYASNNTEPHHD